MAQACLESCWYALISSSCHLPLIQSGSCLITPLYWLLQTDPEILLALMSTVVSQSSSYLDSQLFDSVDYQLSLDPFLIGNLIFFFFVDLHPSQSHLQAYFFLHMDYVPQSCSSKTQTFTMHSLWATTHCPLLRAPPVHRLQVKMAPAGFSPSSRSMPIPHFYFPMSTSILKTNLKTQLVHSGLHDLLTHTSPLILLLMNLFLLICWKSRCHHAPLGIQLIKNKC